MLAVFPDIKTIFGVKFIHLVNERFLMAKAWTDFLIHIQVYHFMYQDIPKVLWRVSNISGN